jgi:hypothetical protein
MKFKMLMLSVLLLAFSLPVLAQDNAAVVMPEERMFTVGGWMDLIGFISRSDDIPKQDFENFQFSQADLNLYFNFTPHKDLACFTEIAYTYFPGTEKQYDATGNSYPVNNTALDFFSVQKEWGTIYIVRAFMEWHKFSFFQIRVGRMLTPFGIWSQDHGQTVITPIRPPTILAPTWPTDAVPQSVTGLEILGQVSLGQVSTWGNALFNYAAYVANDDTDLDSFGDSDEHWFKACGGYFNFKIPLSIVSLDFGMSYYQGKFIRLGYTNATGTDYYNNNNWHNNLLAHVRLGIAMHRYVELILQGEFMNVWSEVASVKWNPMLYSSGLPKDYTAYSLYALAEFKFFGIFSVYYMLDNQESESNTSYVNETLSHNVGITVWPYPMLALKFEYTRGHVIDADKAYVGEGWVDTVYIAMAMSF